MSSSFLLLLRSDPGLSEVRFSAYKTTCCLLGYDNLLIIGQQEARHCNKRLVNLRP